MQYNTQQGIGVAALIVIIALVAIGGGAAYIATQNQAGVDLDTTGETNGELSTSADGSLAVNTRQSGSVFTVDRVTLNTDGFIIIERVLDGGGRVVVGTSDLLTAGTHSNLIIDLNTSLDVGGEVVVRAVADDGDGEPEPDGGDQTARAEDGGELTISIELEAETDAEAGTDSDGDLPVEPHADVNGDADIDLDADVGIDLGGPNKQVTVTYTDSGFEPATVEIRAGDSVRFVNESSADMWVASNIHPTHQILPEFDQLGAGDEYEFVFTEVGTWNYHNHRAPGDTGTVVVEAFVGQ